MSSKDLVRSTPSLLQPGFRKDRNSGSSPAARGPKGKSPLKKSAWKNLA